MECLSTERNIPNRTNDKWNLHIYLHWGFNGVHIYSICGVGASSNMTYVSGGCYLDSTVSADMFEPPVQRQTPMFKSFDVSFYLTC